MAEKKVEAVVETKTEVREFANGSKYEHVGECKVCGEPVFECITYPLYDEGMAKSYQVVWVKTGSNNEPGLEPYCQRHDPFLAHRMRQGRPASDPILGDTWQPLT